ncbi:hypothetical protein [Puerhibacterium sp. TATVAM-FAB25]|uniref:hypothetical protein n=1 Tax=Puerhibacterium sp. TATVAM-FAB25 TaxID=3093699 RepID=UPI00397AFB68
MTAITLLPDTLTVAFTRAEKVAGLIRDQHVPLSAVRSVEVVPDGLAAARGLRAPGLALPGSRKIGTWRSRSGKTLVSVRSGRPALRVRLDGQRYAELLVDVDRPAEVAAALARVTP